GAPVHDAVFQAHTLHLNADLGAVPGTAKQNLAELPVGSQVTRLTLIGDIASAINEAHSQVEPLALHQDDPLVTDPALVALELARGSHRAVDVAAACVGGHRRQQERIVMQQRRGVKALGELFGDEARVEVAGNEPRMPAEGSLEGEVRRDAANDEAVQCVVHPGDGLVAGAAVGDQLGNHGIIMDGYLITLENARIDPDSAGVLVRRHEADEAAGGGQEVAERVLGVDPALDRPALAADLLLSERKRFAGGDADHELDKVQPGDQLGNRVLDLESRVHLQEEEALVLADDELDGAGGLVAHGPGEGDGLLAHGSAGRLIEKWAGGLFDDLLVPSLDRALAFPKINHLAVRVAEHLDLDVPGLLDKLLDEDPVVAEGVLSLGPARCEALGRFLVAPGNAQAATAAAGRGLDHHRIADLAGDLHGVRGHLDRIVVAGDRVHAGIAGELLGGDLVAHRGDRFVFGPDEDNSFLLQPPGELLVLGEEAVPRVHRLGPGLLAGGDDSVHHQVRFLGRSRANANRLVGQLDMPRVLIGLRIHGNGADTHLACRLDDAAGDFTPVGDQDFLEHGCLGSHSLRMRRDHRAATDNLR